MWLLAGMSSSGAAVLEEAQRLVALCVTASLAAEEFVREVAASPLAALQSRPDLALALACVATLVSVLLGTWVLCGSCCCRPAKGARRPRPPSVQRTEAPEAEEPASAGCAHGLSKDLASATTLHRSALLKFVRVLEHGPYPLPPYAIKLEMLRVRDVIQRDKNLHSAPRLRWLAARQAMDRFVASVAQGGKGKHDDGDAAAFLRAHCYLESFAKGGDAFLAQLKRGYEGKSAEEPTTRISALTSEVNRAPRAATEAALRRLVQCDCLGAKPT